jgi:8-oxo-dGTP pyrophosphatase MutT (NUDIX family)
MPQYLAEYLNLEASFMAIDATLVNVAIAILYQDGKFLMQLRDDIPGIFYAGHWGFFGGHLEPDEPPEAGARRELTEEIGHCPEQLHKFEFYPPDGRVVRHVFHAPLAVDLNRLSLNEGQDMKLVSVAEINRGLAYSHHLGEDRPLGKPHQQILQAFLQSGFAQMPG